MAKARDEFYHNEKHFMLYTERAHFYKRYRLKGIRHLVFFQPPMYPGMNIEQLPFIQNWKIEMLISQEALPTCATFNRQFTRILRGEVIPTCLAL